MNRKKRNTMNTIKEKAKEIVLSSTILGLPNVVSKKRIVFKMMWLVAFLVSASVGIFTMQKTLSNYLEYEAVTKIDVKNEIPTEFPASKK